MSTQAVTVALPASTLSVSGTVNGVTASWTNTSDNTWSAVVARAPDGVYVLALSVTDAEGFVTRLTAVLFFGGLQLVTDRSAQDVARWKELRDKGWSGMSAEEQAEWMGTMKGCYSHTDMNRVEGAVKWLSDRLSAIGYVYSPSVKLDWTREDIPSREDMARYFGNVEGLKEVIVMFPTVPPVPSVDDAFDYVMANNLEQFLLAVDEIYQKITESWHYAGEIISGGE